MPSRNSSPLKNTFHLQHSPVIVKFQAKLDSNANEVIFMWYCEFFAEVPKKETQNYANYLDILWNKLFDKVLCYFQ